MKKSKASTMSIESWASIGKQGVIPELNVRNLVLRSDVVQAVADGKFHIYPVRTIDEGLAILAETTLDGDADSRSLNRLVAGRLKELALGLKEFAATSADGGKR